MFQVATIPYTTAAGRKADQLVCRRAWASAGVHAAAWDVMGGGAAVLGASSDYRIGRARLAAAAPALVARPEIGYVRGMSSSILLARSARTGPASALALILGLLLLLRLART